MSLPSDFNHSEYLELNQDLKQTCSYEEATHHYINYGFRENRKYKKYNNNNKNENNMNLLIVVVSCCKHKHLWNNIKSRTSNNLIIIAGTNDRAIEKRWYDKNEKILWLNCNDYYDGLPEKMVLAIEEILNNPEFSNVTHILKIDDHDTDFNDDNICKLYHNDAIKNHDYVGQKLNNWGQLSDCTYHFGKVPEWSIWNNRHADISNISYFDGGCSYILSRRAMQLVINEWNDKNIDHLRTCEIYEDVVMGKILINKNNVSYKEVNYGIKGDK